MIRSSAEDRQSLGQTGRCGGLWCDRADDVVRGVFGRDRPGRQMRQRHEIPGDGVVGEVDEPGLERPVVLDPAMAGEAQVDEVVGAEDRGNAGKDLGLVGFDPAQLRGHQLLVDAVAGAGEEVGLGHLGGKRPHLGAAAPVALLDRGAEQLAVGVEQHHRGQHPGDADAAQAGALGQGLHDLGQHLAGVGPPLLGVFFGPAVMR